MKNQSFNYFNSKSNNFNPEIAWWLAKFSKLAYENKENVSKVLKKLGFKKIIFFDNKGTQAYLTFHKKFGILAFRGTEKDFKDILTHIHFYQKKTRDGKYNVHAGFLKALNKIWLMKNKKGLKDYLDKVKTPVYYTGHSLGAALATLAAKRKQPKSLYTFGSPRVVDNILSDYLSKHINIYRIINSIDIVTFLPFNHEHTGKPVYIDKNGKIWKNNYRIIMIIEFLLGILSFVTLILPNILVKRIRPNIFTNHKISEYIRKIKLKIKKN